MNLTQLPKKGIEFLKETHHELRRVTWPTRDQAIKHTLMVIGVTLTIAFFLGGLDLLFSWLLDNFIV